MVRFNNLIWRLELPNSSSAQKQNQIQPKKNFSQPIFWGLDAGPKKGQLLKVAPFTNASIHLDTNTEQIVRLPVQRGHDLVRRRLSNVGQSCGRK